MTKTSQKRLVPKLRFRSFTGNWEQRKFGDIISLTGGGTPSKAKPDYWKGPIVWLSSQEIKERFISYGTYTISETAVKDSATKMVPAGTPLIVYRSGILAHTFPISRPTRDVAINQDIKALIFDPAVLVNNFVVAELESKESFILHNIVKTGTTVQSVNIPDLKKMEFTLPEISEQEAIGNFIEQISSTIALHQREQVLLQRLKQGYLQKLFPRNGQKVSELRFPGFTGDWEQRKFGALVELERGLTYKPSDVVSKSGIRVLRSSNIDNDTFVERPDDVFVQQSAANLEEVNNGDILITAANGSSRLVGKHAVVKELSGATTHGGFMLLVRTPESVFINALMSAPWYRKFIATFVAGGNGAIGNLKASDLAGQSVMVPAKLERDKIAEFFGTLDNAIALHQQELDKLKQLKQAYLQQLFV
ncbi:restriction endonuclease subunit S [Lacticaseibacillus hegangensis]|uniref:Restriction endonuclease subunit S n=1 Tax=Lacticaseibacillus hegangensis TaxID=2486010 RepID=A0ABW4CWA4_9LACO|nr:restriction endonuclease subunit S [Lacticaseibacillus hegangensis]